MTEFSFKQKQDLLIPQTDVFRPPLDEHGNQLSGDDLIRRMCNAADSYEKKTKHAVPVDPKVVAWLRQAKDMLGKGMTSEQIFAKTIAATAGV